MAGFHEEVPQQVFVDERLRQVLKDGDILDLAGCVDVGIQGL